MSYVLTQKEHTVSSSDGDTSDVDLYVQSDDSATLISPEMIKLTALKALSDVKFPVCSKASSQAES